MHSQAWTPTCPLPPRFCVVWAAFMRQRDFLSGMCGELKGPLYLPPAWGEGFQIPLVCKAGVAESEQRKPFYV